MTTRWSYSWSYLISGSPVAQPHTLQQAKALAMSAIDVMCDEQLLQDIKVDFENSLKDLQQS